LQRRTPDKRWISVTKSLQYAPFSAAAGCPRIG
jgi:hypothetical protein